MAKRSKHSKSIWVTPFGAGVAVVCFFLPWGRASCGGVSHEFSGTNSGAVLWGVPILCGLVLALFLSFHRRKQMTGAQPLSLITLGAAFLLLLYRAVLASVQMDSLQGRFLQSFLSIEPRPGGLLFLAGLSLALLGAAFCRWRPKR